MGTLRCRTLADALVIAMAYQRMPVQVLAEKSGVAANQISDYRGRRGEPRLNQVARLARALNISADWLLGLDPRPEPTPLVSKCVHGIQLEGVQDD